MGRTIPSFRIAVVLEEKKWKEFRKYLRNKNERKLFDNMFSIANLYNSASSNAVIPIRIHPIMMSIIFHHYKILTEKSDDINNDDDDDEYNINNNSIILQQELDKWNNYSSILRKSNRNLFKEMLRSSYKYSNAINAKGEHFSTESLFMSLIFEQHKKMIFLNSNHNNNSSSSLYSSSTTTTNLTPFF